MTKNNSMELDPEKTKVLDKMADFIIKKDLGVIAIMYIESMRPLHRISSNFITFFEPFLNLVVSGNNLQTIRSCLEEDKYMDYLLERIEKGRDVLK